MKKWNIVHMKVASTIPENVLRSWVDKAREDIAQKAKILHQTIEIQNWQE